LHVIASVGLCHAKPPTIALAGTSRVTQQEAVQE
jgi:hypothetical protein